MPFASVAGTDVFFGGAEDPAAGLGQVVLLVHGAFDHHDLWRDVVPALARDHTPVAVDLPGHGRSPGPVLDRAEAYRAFLAGLTDALRLPPFVFCGHSMGGSMAVDFALHHPDRVAGLIPIGSSPDWDIPDFFIDGWDTDPEAVYRENRDYLFSKRTARGLIDAYDRQMRETPPAHCQADMRTCASFDQAGRLGEVRTPTAVICGDEEFWIDGSRALHAGIAGATLDILPAAGHALPLEQPDALSAAILRFLDSLAR
ncbi:MAG: alpha/beta fold hydrolase [Rhodospirillaceae bacterium]|jgi:3-oxoadipate enol-lactonase|nr:alpha/beta fold hydrolase [Rhodospirillaceae bacterium]MBT6118633.1 alpha/beta fold hydrolase [Rhodospirillaceae bacterium]